ncbi:GntR family transcriptional regulator YhfZ [Serratia quinivorans]|jgi:hypothetical protein|uniref:GntR family transcriptional regulator YhfZ n=1 Tax=Serratia quinivorans TaxID=137545 RepID=UPI00217AE254|nr:GntR family transcriptional regulator YhfZ [Serratia quinivorans]CAI1160484.1 Uncharacterised protein [Serratia quinivorans]
MRDKFIKKEGIAIIQLARYLLDEQPSNRLRTIDELSESFGLSVGIIQNALKSLETNGCIQLERRGRNGTRLKQLNYQALLAQADIGNLVCAMPLPYTKLYEGLASGLKIQFGQIPLYYAHMRGASVRIECLLDGIYDMAVVSRLAARQVLQDGKARIALELGAGSYVSEHQMVCRCGEQNNIRRVGLDPRSPDQRQLSELYFQDKNVQYIDTPYHDCLTQIEKGNIDAAIWNVVQNFASSNLIAIALQGQPQYTQATEAVLLIRNDDTLIQRLVARQVDKKQLLEHQKNVLSGKEEPFY